MIMNHKVPNYDSPCSDIHDGISVFELKEIESEYDSIFVEIFHNPLKVNGIEVTNLLILYMDLLYFDI